MSVAGGLTMSKVYQYQVSRDKLSVLRYCYHVNENQVILADRLMFSGYSS